jgi:hypothetical protein
VTLLLHGVVWADHPTTARLVTWQDLAVVVSEAGTPDAVAHLELLSGLVTTGPVVPLRFGTTTDGEDAVRTDVLAARAEELRGHLRHLTGLVELHAYLRFDEDEALQAVFYEHQAAWPGTGGLDLATRIRLGEQVAQHLVTWRRARSDALLAPVSAVAREHVVLPDREHTEERRAFLIPREEIDTARAAVTALRQVAAVEADCVGPLPAYHFLDETPRGEAATGSRWGW